MALNEIKIPSLGEGIIEVTIIRWLVREGDKIEKNTPLAEIATDKVDSQIESEFEGRILKIYCPQGDIVRVGETICVVGDKESAEEYQPTRSAIGIQTTTTTLLPEISVGSITGKAHTKISDRFFSPLVRTIATDFGLSPGELEGIQGTGNSGQVTKDDIMAYLRTRPTVSTLNGAQGPVQKPSPAAPPESNPLIIPDFGPDQEIEIAEMDRVRQLIARNIQQSVNEIPHATSFTEADLTNLAHWRDNNKASFEKQSGYKLTFTVLFIEKIAQILRRYPLLNATIDGANIYLKKHINVGMATALENGNLVVPVIKDADKKNLTGIAREVNELATKARTGTLLPADTRGGSFTITNVGQFNTLTGIPIINKPEVGIIAVGAITKQPGVVKTGNSYGLAVRDKMIIAMSYDHRLIDGAMAGRFLEDFRLSLETELPGLM